MQMYQMMVYIAANDTQQMDYMKLDMLTNLIAEYDTHFKSIQEGLRDYGVEAVEVACDLAISSNVINSQHIINSITRLKCEENAPILDVADSLKLTNPPIADCNNYDQLLGSI